MEIVPFNSAHFDSFLRSAKGEGWITGEWELAFLIKNYPDGCLVVFDAGQPTAFITAIRYADSAWIGNLLVLPEYRCRGIGRSLLEKVLASLDCSGCETVWLTASAAGAHLYRTLGFVQIDGVQRWKGSGSAAIGGAKPASTAAAATIDHLGWGDNRRAIFEAQPENCRCFSAQDGFLVQSSSADGRQLGPWGALTDETAAHLLEAAIGGDVTGGEIFLDVPEKNQAAAKLLSARGFSVSGSTLLMYRGRVPEYRPKYIYSLASMGSYG